MRGVYLTPLFSSSEGHEGSWAEKNSILLEFMGILESNLNLRKNEFLISLLSHGLEVRIQVCGGLSLHDIHFTNFSKPGKNISMPCIYSHSLKVYLTETQ